MSTLKYHDLKVVLFEDIPGSEPFVSGEETFNHITYGDAVYTLVYPEQILDELDEEYHAKLIEELKKLPKDILVAIRG